MASTLSRELLGDDREDPPSRSRRDLSILVPCLLVALALVVATAGVIWHLTSAATGMQHTPPVPAASRPLATAPSAPRTAAPTASPAAPAATTATPPAPRTTSTPGALPSPAPAHRTAAPFPVTPPVPTTVYYQNCSAAFAAGVSNIPRGAPGYRPALDRDSDGIACEKPTPATTAPRPAPSPPPAAPSAAPPPPTRTPPPTPTAASTTRPTPTAAPSPPASAPPSTTPTTTPPASTSTASTTPPVTSSSATTTPAARS